MGFAGFEVSGGQAGSVIERVEKQIEDAAPLIFDAAVGNRALACAFGGAHSRAISLGDVVSDEPGIAGAPELGRSVPQGCDFA